MSIKFVPFILERGVRSQEMMVGFEKKMNSYNRIIAHDRSDV